ncbi:hypothetical protein ACFY0R_20030 [Streptomyces sp. NPDC001633]|uniref:hypothetical protein n=1 Tax=Streptomyces sp. NPDC001633 TaxID=3364595 RepID=UPI003679353A
MAKFYGAAELDGVLAGFRSRGPATLWRCLEPGTLWQPVLQATVMANTDGGPRVLTGTRRADTNPTHPNVISTPTSMLPLSFARCYVDSVADSAVETTPIHFTELRADDLRTMARFPETAVRTRYPTRPPESPTWWGTCSPASSAGAAPWNRLPGEALGTCRFSMIGAGFSYVADRPTTDPESPEPLYEPLLMFGAVLELTDHTVIPEHTDSYKDLCWTAPADYAEGVRTKRIESFHPKFLNIADEADSDSVTVCARGLCLQTTNKVIADLASAGSAESAAI